MYIKRFFIFCVMILLAGCATKQENWMIEYGTLETSAPVQLMYGSENLHIGTPSDNLIGAPVHTMAVLLPLSGDNAPVGETIRTSIETAVLQNAPQNLSVAFFDTAKNPDTVFTEALSINPEIIVGPVFSKDARQIKYAKPETLPVLSFTSDANALGSGVMTMALMPTNGVEEIVKEMSYDNIKDFIILAPNTQSGRLMAGAALKASEIYHVPNVGVFYYTENDTDSIKNISQKASMYDTRTAANTRAREILSDILTKERLTTIEKSSMTIQLDNLSKTETLGKIPYDAILFLGSGDDTETLVSFLRYYGINSGYTKFYGTAVWEGSDIAQDITMRGAKYATLPEISADFSNLYEQMSGKPANRLASFGYDATNMAIGMIYSPKSNAAYLLDPSGYIGIDGLFRLKPTGENERALRIVQLSGDGTISTVREADKTFITPIYSIEQHNINPANDMALETAGINPNDYINIPERLRGKYKSKTYGANITQTPVLPVQENIVILPEDDSDAIVSEDFKPVSLESVNRTYIDSVEIEE